MGTFMAATIQVAEVFLDTSFAVALAAKTDEFHAAAKALAAELRKSKQPVVTTRAVTLEIGNALSGERHRSAAARLLRSFERDPRLTIEPMTEDLYQAALALFESRSDKEWGVIDCASFIVMKRRRITSALTADLHYRQAGFQALLLNGR